MTTGAGEAVLESVPLPLALALALDEPAVVDADAPAAPPRSARGLRVSLMVGIETEGVGVGERGCEHSLRERERESVVWKGGGRGRRS